MYNERVKKEVEERFARWTEIRYVVMSYIFESEEADLAKAKILIKRINEIFEMNE